LADQKISLSNSMQIAGRAIAANAKKRQATGRAKCGA